MPIDFGSIKTVFDIFLKLRDAYAALTKSNIFLKETGISDLVEKYFSFEQLPKGEVRLVGKLSNFTLTNNFPVYSPFRTTATNEKVVKEVFNKSRGKFEKIYDLTTQMEALHVPAICHNSIKLEDGSFAKIVWLYSEENKGLLLGLKGKKLDANDILNLYEIENTDRPIPVLVDTNFPTSQFLYRRVKIKGRIVTANSKHFEILSSTLNPFLLNYMRNCFRPFSNNEGVLAIDLRKPHGHVENLEAHPSPFPIIYTVQGTIGIGPKIEEKRIMDLLIRSSIESIPDRQGMGRGVTAFGYDTHPVYSVLTIGDINWQLIHEPLTFAAYVSIDASNPYDYQSKITKLSHHWGVWQKSCRASIRKGFDIEPVIYPLICSNSLNESEFHPNGLQIPMELERKLLSHDPNLRASIDWLGISTGRK